MRQPSTSRQPKEEICVRYFADGKSCAEWRPRTGSFWDDIPTVTGTQPPPAAPTKSFLQEHPQALVGLALLAGTIFRAIQSSQKRNDGQSPTVSDWFKLHRNKFAGVLLILGSGLLVEGIALEDTSGSIAFGTMMAVGGGLLWRSKDR